MSKDLVEKQKLGWLDNADARLRAIVSDAEEQFRVITNESTAKLRVTIFTAAGTQQTLVPEAFGSIAGGLNIRDAFRVPCDRQFSGHRDRFLHRYFRICIGWNGSRL